MLIERFLRLTDIEKGHLLWIAETASRRYKTYEIAKKNGGQRVISHPARDIKAIQRWLNRVVFSRFPVHECATAYKKGASIRQNAHIHSQSNFTLHLDFKNFFPSFDSEMISAFLVNKSKVYGIELDNIDISFICKIVTKDSHLTIGAPSSPIITNAIMYNFDQLMYEYCKCCNFIYTRYADDIFISSTLPNALNDAREEAYDIARHLFGDKLIFNASKTRFHSRKYRRCITGLILTHDKNVSIGRRRKREIRTLIFNYKLGEADPIKIARLRGLIAFCMDVEPSFVNTLKLKYGETTIISLMSDKRLDTKKHIAR